MDFLISGTLKKKKKILFLSTETVFLLKCQLTDCFLTTQKGVLCRGHEICWESRKITLHKQFSQKWEIDKLASTNAQQRKTAFKIALKVSHFLALSVESGQKKRGSSHTVLKTLPIWLLNKVATKSGIMGLPPKKKIFKECKIRIAIE